jgi:PAS domain S-box-containing protein
MNRDIQEETTLVNKQLLHQMLELSEAILKGDFSKRIVADFGESPMHKIAANLNQLSDQIQLNDVRGSQQQTVNSFIEVISSFANLDFNHKLPISENGTVMDAIATGINILGEELEQSTASKQELEMERNKLNEAQSIAKVGSWQLDVTSMSLKASDEAYQIFGIDKKQTSDLFAAAAKKMRKKDRSKLKSLISHAIEKDQAFATELKIDDEKGSIKYTICIGKPIKDNANRVYCLEGTVQDITERKHIEETLKEAKEFAEEANNSKSRFLANMSHEIRTPLNGILGLTEIMLGENLSDEHRKYLEIVRESGKNLAKLINDILDLSKIESKKLQLEYIPFDFSKTIIANINSYKFLADQKGLGLTYYIDGSIPSEVIGDPTRVSQILTNLISNAMKFTEEGGIEVNFSLQELKDDEVTISGEVKDTGSGIPKDKLDVIFQSFTQADDSITRKYGGTGLGLSIVKNLVTHMKGTIVVNSPVDPVLNRGSVFRFSLKLKLPAKKAQRVESGNIETKLRFNKALHILVVDDNPVNLLVAKKMIQKFGAKVTIAESGYNAIDLVKREEYDLILMDIQMPGINGFETALEIRRLNYIKPIIALSANAYDDDIQSSLSSGMNDHIKKPYSEQHLFEVINIHIEGQTVPVNKH